MGRLAPRLPNTCGRDAQSTGSHREKLPGKTSSSPQRRPPRRGDRSPCVPGGASGSPGGARCTGRRVHEAPAHPTSFLAWLACFLFARWTAVGLAFTSLAKALPTKNPRCRGKCLLRTLADCCRITGSYQLRVPRGSHLAVDGTPSRALRLNGCPPVSRRCPHPRSEKRLPSSSHGPPCPRSDWLQNPRHTNLKVVHPGANPGHKADDGPVHGKQRSIHTPPVLSRRESVSERLLQACWGCRSSISASLLAHSANQPAGGPTGRPKARGTPSQRNGCAAANHRFLFCIFAFVSLLLP